MIDERRLDKILAVLLNYYRLECPQMALAEKLFEDRYIHNDHIAFRSIRSEYTDGIDPQRGFWERCGFKKAAEYDLGNKYAIHMEHPHPRFPKIFLSEFTVKKLSHEDAKFVNGLMCDYQRNVLAATMHGDRKGEGFSVDLLPVEELVNFFLLNPFILPPKKADLEKLNEIDQYLAWTRLFGNKVNHFTLSCNALELPIKDVWRKMAGTEGISMKPTIDGEGTELAQTSTTASVLKVPVITDDEELAYIEWPYAYYEVIERGQAIFQGFKAAQTPGLFAMTGKDKQ